MEGLVKIVIRKENYDLIYMVCNIEKASKLIHDPNIFLNKDNTLDLFIEKNDCYLTERLAPCDYGIIVIDFKTKTLISCQNYSSTAPFFLFQPKIKRTKAKIDFSYGTYSEKEFLHHLKNGMFKSIIDKKTENRVSLTSINDIKSFTEKAIEAYNESKYNGSMFHLEIERNNFLTYFWQKKDLPDARLKMKEIGIVFNKEDEQLWLDFYSLNAEN